MFTAAGRTLELMQVKEIEQLLGTIIDVSTEDSGKVVLFNLYPRFIQISLWKPTKG